MTVYRQPLVVSFCALIALGVLLPGHAWSNSRSFAYKRIVSSTTPGAGNFLRPTVVVLRPGTNQIYFAQQDGRIFWAELDVNSNVSLVHEIDTIYNYIFNKPKRLIAGMAFGPDTDLYVSHSDGLFKDTNVDITSGTITRLHPDGTFVADIATGLPRSKYDHGPNGLAFGVGANNTRLYLAQGSMTNEGMPAGGPPAPATEYPFLGWRKSSTARPSWSST
jgi:hypothetical protein